MTKLYENQQEAIAAVFVGRRIVAVDQQAETLTLDNGTTLEVHANSGCGGCSSGWYEVTSLAGTDAVITSAKVNSDDNDEGDTVYTVAVYAAGVTTNAIVVTGDDGNGYYGTGFSLQVTEQKS